MRQYIHKIKQILLPQERRLMVGMVAMDLTIALLDIFFLATLVLLVQSLIQPGAVKWLPSIIKNEPLPSWALFILLYAIKNFLAYRLAKYQFHFVYQVAARLSAGQLDQYFGLEYEDFVRVDSSVYTRKISQQPVEFAHYVLRGLQMAVGQAIMSGMFTLALLLYEPRLFLLLFAVLIPPLFIMGRQIRKNAANARTEVKMAGEHALRFLKEALAGFVECRIYFKKEFFISRYARSQKQLNGFLAAQQQLQVLPSRLMEVFALAGLFLLLVFSYVLHGKTASFITLGAFLAAAYRIIPGMVKMLNGWAQVRSYGFVLDGLLPAAILKTDPAIHEGMEHIRSIRFDHVSFSFGASSVFTDLEFQLQPGSFLGVKGISGRGKSTLVNLLLGFHAPSSGKILVNGQEMNPGMRADFWKRVSYVKQQPYFIHDSAFRNVVLCEEGDEEQLLKSTEFHGIRSMMNGSSSRILSENGKNISGGQRQRIALARALYKDFDLLVLDEPFSELDEEAGSGFVKQLRELAAEGRIIVLISHDHSLLDHCNQIISLDEKH